MRGCASHCAACGRHFAGDGAFDLHRRGSHQAGRRCVDPNDEPRLTVVAEDAVCKISGEMDDDWRAITLHAVKLWGEARNKGTAAMRAWDTAWSREGAARIDGEAGAR